MGGATRPQRGSNQADLERKPRIAFQSTRPREGATADMLTKCRQSRNRDIFANPGGRGCLHRRSPRWSSRYPVLNERFAAGADLRRDRRSPSVRDEISHDERTLQIERWLSADVLHPALPVASKEIEPQTVLARFDDSEQP